MTPLPHPPNQVDEIISQPELDALSDTLSAYLAQQPDKQELEVTLWDFSSAYDLSAAHLQHVSRACQAASAVLNRILGVYLNSVVQFDFEGVERMRASQYLPQLPDDALVAFFSLKPGLSKGVFHLDRRLAYTVFDLMLGGSGRDSYVRRTSISRIDASLFRLFAKEVLTTMKNAAKHINWHSPEISEVYPSPAEAEVYTEDDWALAISYYLQIGSQKGFMTYGIPSSTIKQLLTPNSQHGMTKDDAAKAMADSVRGCPVEIGAIYVRTKVSLNELLALSEGDVIDLRVPAKVNTPVEITIQGQTKFTGVCGVHEGQMAVQIRSPYHC